MSNISAIITSKLLNETMSDSSQSNLVIIDASYPDGKTSFLKSHIKGAQFINLDSDLSDAKSNLASGGRHPLPSINNFIEVLRRLGISKDSHVVIYDHNSGAFAARMWWMLRAINHKMVQVLDGGFKEAMAYNIPCATGEALFVKETNYTIDNSTSLWLSKTSDINDVENALKNENNKVIDVRSTPRYLGEIEPIDPVGGHIIGAINIPFSTNLTPQGRFKTASELKNKYINALGESKPNQCIFHCGSGVTACHSILALDIAGLDMPSLYIGSWSEWSRSDKPMATKK